jgi:hypothetical protein
MKKKIAGNLYWTGRGLGYQVSSPRRARRLNIVLVAVCLLLIVTVCFVA